MQSVTELIREAELSLHAAFKEIDERELIILERVLDAFQSKRVSARHFAPTNGYGYDDAGRDCLDRVFAAAMEAEDAIVSPQIANGTHALFLALNALLMPGDTALSISGAPYDTLRGAIGLDGNLPGSLSGKGVGFCEIPLLDGAGIDIERALKYMEGQSVKLVYVQRSRGYADRKSLAATELRAAFTQIKSASPNTIILVDNCYGEFTELHEPCALGADIMAGSLIKNPGGGLAPTGGYVAGRADLIERVANLLTVPGCGREIGSYEASYRPFFQGLFMAPHTVAQCQKTARLFAAVLKKMGYDCNPAFNEERADIIQSVTFGNERDLTAFCRAIQAAAPVDSFAVPQPWAMPGYADPVIMAAGTFVQGATSELSCDAPIRPPYTAYVQGSLSYAHGKIALFRAVNALLDKE